MELGKLTPGAQFSKPAKPLKLVSMDAYTLSLKNFFLEQQMFASICVENCLPVLNEGKHLCLFSKMRNTSAILKFLNRQE